MSEYKHLILMVEDDEDVALLNTRLLKRSGYEVLVAYSVSEALKCLIGNKPDLFIVDVELPDGDGFDLCVEFRKISDAPVMFLTGRKLPADRLTGMSLGGDYYITKPYDRSEFLGMVKVLLAKAGLSRDKFSKAVEEATVIKRGRLTLDIRCGKAFVDGCDRELTQKEFAILLLLIQNENKEMSAKHLYEKVWNTPMNDDPAALQKHILRIKKKLDADNADDFAIVTLYGRGFAFTTK